MPGNNVREPAWREKIQAGVLMTRLNDHALGNIQMTKTQIEAAKVILKKIVPDLQNINLEARVNGTLTLQGVLGEIDGRSSDLPSHQG